MDETKRRELMDAAEALALIPSKEYMDGFAQSTVRKWGFDASFAPLWRDRLRYTYAKIQETKYPDYVAAEGGVLPIDTSPNPGHLTWEYYKVDHAGFADWIDDEGEVAPESSVKMSRFTGEMHEMGHVWKLNQFDLERDREMDGPAVQLATVKQKAAKRAHMARRNWIWLFGDSDKNLPGLFNNPSVPITAAPAAAGGGNAVHWLDGDKTIGEVLADVQDCIDTVAENTLEAYHAAKVFMAPRMWRYLRNTRMADGGGDRTLLEYLKATYAGDESGQGRVEFLMLNECQGDRRRDPKTGTDTSAITGDFMFAIPAADKDELAFILARDYTQKPPQETGFTMSHFTHSRIGGCKCQIPLACHRLDFGSPS